MFRHFLLQATATPIPHDIPLPLPLPEWVLVIILVFSFLAHILFVNLMLGGTILTLWAEVKGRKQPEYDELAHEIAKTITVNKSLAVVLGVAPLLSINTLYTIYFYSANALTGLMWIAIVPLVTIAFLLTYLHKYTWRQMMRHKSLHISIVAAALAIFLFIPFIFLTNINLMLFPEKWGVVRGFLSAMLLPNVFPRYLHFLLSSLAVTGLFLFWYMGRSRYPFAAHFKRITQYDLQRQCYTLALGASAAQFIIGPVVLLTLPAKGIGMNLIAIIIGGAAMAVPAMWWMWKRISGPPEEIRKGYTKVVLCLGTTVLFMGSGRQVYRANALAFHQRQVAAKTRDFQQLSAEARTAAAAGSNTAAAVTAGKTPDGEGKALFQQYCGACHHKDNKLIGPPMTEMVSIYKDDIPGLKSWIKHPGKKRAGYPQMPSFEGVLKAEELDNVVAYILSIQK